MLRLGLGISLCFAILGCSNTAPATTVTSTAPNGPALAIPASLTLTGSPAANLAKVTSARVRTLIDADWKFSPKDYDYLGPSTPVNGWQVQPATGITSGQITQLPSLPSAWQSYNVGDDAFNGQPGFAWFQATLPPITRPSVDITFLSVDDNATVWVNGHYMTYHQGWDLPFTIDISSVLKPGGPNVVVVLCENTGGKGGFDAGVTLLEPTGTSGPALAKFDDTAWRTVHLPHDYVSENAHSQSADEAHGFIPVNVAWYRKSLAIPKTAAGNHFWLEFDGVYRDSKVWVNGHLAGEHQSGYTSFYYDITPYVTPGQTAEIAVRVDPTFFEGWFYEGGGIYRHVWLTSVPPVHVGHWGTFVATASLADLTNGAATSATLNIKTDVSNDTGAAAPGVVVQSQILSPSGAVVAQTATSVEAPAGQTGTVAQQIEIDKPALWSLTSRNMYKLVTTISSGGTADVVTTPFGIRTFTYDPDKGLFLNGAHVEVQGTCNHQDLAGIGTALPDNLLAWRVKKLIGMGSNAYRTSHNPPTGELLDACDQQGMLVLDENRHLGNTYMAKSPVGTVFNDPTDLNALILRDRNHPSIFMWSLCNEENPMMGKPEYPVMQKAMEADVKTLDPTRPCTAAEFGWKKGTDVDGVNYNIWAYDADHNNNPGTPMIATEDASEVATRGIYERGNNYEPEYDQNDPFISWGNNLEDAWSNIAKHPWIEGGFSWTGFDYRGEPTPYHWPDVNGGWGVMDMCGFPKAGYYYYQSVWLPATTPVVHLVAPWNPTSTGKTVDVWVYSNAPEVELFVNGTSQGKKNVPSMGHAEWKVPYAAGTLSAIGAKNGQRFGSDQIVTPGPAASIQLRSDISSVKANGEDISPVEVSILDNRGILCTTADNEVTFTVSGPGQIAGVGNGNPTDLEPDYGTKRAAFNGHCMVLVRSTGKPGTIVVTASAPGLPSASYSVTAK